MLKQTLIFLCCTLVLGAEARAEDAQTFEPIGFTIGADLSRKLSGPLALSTPAPTLQEENLNDFFDGSRLFHLPWQMAPDGAHMVNGLPMFGLGPGAAAHSCTACHTNAGRMGEADDRLLERWSPAMVGIGLLDQIPEADLDTATDPDDLNGDGIYGMRGRGRFGWTAQTKTIEESVGRALCVDMGLMNTAYREEGCDKPSEVPDAFIRSLVVYVGNLAIPDRSPRTAPAILGEKLFHDVGCAVCHTPTQKTSDGQTFHPFSNLLLHDMGAGLTDSQGNRYWRTAPLWTIGKQPEVSHTQYLHDGRAKTLNEAITYHGGEAETTRRTFEALNASDQAAIIAFLESL